MKNRVEKAILAFASDKPAFGQVRVSNELKKQGLFVSPGAVRSVWLRHDLEVLESAPVSPLAAFFLRYAYR